jgi:hypothetical protein
MECLITYELTAFAALLHLLVILPLHREWVLTFSHTLTSLSTLNRMTREVGVS